MVTLKDVAEACGVSQATVSQVLHNGRRPVHAETRARVLAAARALDYRPNAVARGLTRKRMNTIGLVFQHADTLASSNPFLMGVLDGVLSVTTRRRQSAMLCTIPNWDAPECPPELSDGRCDGVLLLVPSGECPWPQTLTRLKVPFVLVGSEDPAGQAASVKVDDIRAAEEMTRYLLGLGHQRVGFVCREVDRAFSFVQDRLEGYRRAMAAAGLKTDVLLYDRAAALDYVAPNQPTALFCTHDIIALSLIADLTRRGVRIPDDVSVVGFDDIPEAASSTPPLTTMRQPMAQIGEWAAETLLAMIEGGSPSGIPEQMATERIIRGSASSAPR